MAGQKSPHTNVLFEGSYSYRKRTALFTGFVLLALSSYAIYMAFVIADHQYSTGHKRWLFNALFVSAIGAFFMFGAFWMLHRFFSRSELKLIISLQGISYAGTFSAWQDVRSIGCTLTEGDYQVCY